MKKTLTVHHFNQLVLSVVPWNGEATCPLCRRILDRGKYVVRVDIKGADAWLLGASPEPPVVCCDHELYIRAVFESYRDAEERIAEVESRALLAFVAGKKMPFEFHSSSESMLCLLLKQNP